MDQPTPSAPFWDSVRAWADSMGLLLPQEEGPAGDPVRPRVPQSVCDSCPICQAAATLDQVNADAVAELVDVARSLIGGIGSALASAAEQRLASTQPDRGDREGRDREGDDREGDEPHGSELPSTDPSDPDES